MKRLQELREVFRLTQADLAKSLAVSQQTIARWEGGKTEPNLANLRDLAMIFGTSVDDLLGATDNSAQVVTNSYGAFFDDSIDGFWGHLGLLCSGSEKERWYPITDGESGRVRASLGDVDECWIAVRTLNNRMLLFCANRLKRISLLDEASDEPASGWELAWDADQGHPLELYAALESRLLEDEGYAESTSEKLRSIVEEVIKNSKLTREELIYDLCYTRLIQTDGHEWCMNVEYSKLYDAFCYAELGNMAAFALGDENGHESFFPANSVCLIDMPYREFLKGAEKARQEMELEATRHDGLYHKRARRSRQPTQLSNSSNTLGARS